MCPHRGTHRRPMTGSSVQPLSNQGAASAAWLDILQGASGLVLVLFMGVEIGLLAGVALLARSPLALPPLAQSALVLQAASSHVKSARQKGWTLPTLVEYPEEGAASVGTGRPSFDAAGLSAWWMERSDPATHRCATDPGPQDREPLLCRGPLAQNRGKASPSIRRGRR